MKRRKFIHTTLAATTVTGASLSAEAIAARKTPGREYYEVRVYQIKSAEKQPLLDDYLQKVAIPAYNRMGIKTVGAFKATNDPNNLAVYLLIPYQSLEQFLKASTQVSGELAYNASAAAYAGVPMKDPVYDRIESSLLLAFEAMPQLKVPTRKERIFELRIYESHNGKAGKQKVKMFNAGGEIPIFLKTGLNPVFFGESLTGTRLPNLTYMLTFDNTETRQQAWDAFGKHPDWQKLSKEEEYKDTVSKITSIIMAPTAYSQV